MDVPIIQPEFSTLDITVLFVYNRVDYCSALLSALLKMF